MGSLKKPRITKATLDKKAETNFFTELKCRYESLELEKEDLAKHVKSLLAINDKLDKENKKLKIEREEILVMCQKLDKEVQRLVDEINEPPELEDK